jgi:hypothetical protein
MTIRDEFNARLRAAMDECANLGYPPNRIRQMFDASHPVEVAKRLVVSGDFQEGFRAVIAMGRPDLTIESIMLEERYSSLFTAQELQAARWRLNNV